MPFYNEIKQIFDSINLQFCDSSALDIITSNEFSKIMKIIPKWGKIFHNCLDIDKEETYRTIKHIFRSIYMYFSIRDACFQTNINKKFIEYLNSNINTLYDIHPDLFLVLLLYHDIGRPFNKEWHTFESALLIQKEHLIDNINLSQIHKLILIGVIKYHLLLGTIFTGESSYVGTLSLFNDKSLEIIWDSEKYTELFFLILQLFTIIDILGYDYSKIYNHYLTYYTKIKKHLIEGFSKIREIRDIKKKNELLFHTFHQLDTDNLKWRVACSLRIFQFVSTKPDLTENFYFKKIEEGLDNVGSNWEIFSEKLIKSHSLIQFKYVLPLMMILASGSFSRTPIDKDFIVNKNIYRFWEVCVSKVNTYILNSEDKRFNLWNFVFQFPRNWFQNHEYVKIIRNNYIFSLINSSIPDWNSTCSTFQVHIGVNF